MVEESSHAPASYKGVMVSSTFTDLKQHRAALLRAIDGQELKPVVMENDSAKPDVDVLGSSLRMVQKASAYVGVISHKYGQIPEDPNRNPDGLSLTELEFNEAQRLDRPVLIFIMGDDHAVKRADVEKDPEKIKKLEAFLNQWFMDSRKGAKPQRKSVLEIFAPWRLETSETSGRASFFFVQAKGRAVMPKLRFLERSMAT